MRMVRYAGSVWLFDRPKEQGSQGVADERKQERGAGPASNANAPTRSIVIPQSVTASGPALADATLEILI